MDERDERRPASVPTDPEGPDPTGIPDPMPDDLKRKPSDEPARDPEDDPMEGDAPSG